MATVSLCRASGRGVATLGNACLVAICANTGCIVYAGVDPSSHSGRNGCAAHMVSSEGFNCVWAPSIPKLSDVPISWKERSEGCSIRAMDVEALAFYSTGWQHVEIATHAWHPPSAQPQ